MSALTKSRAEMTSGDAVSRLCTLAASLERALAALDMEIAILTAGGPAAPDTARARGAALRMLALRDKLREIAGPGLLTDTAFDILLDIFASQSLDRAVSVMDICTRSGVAPTTARRSVQKLERMGVVARHGDPDDHRRDWVSLPAVVQSALATILAAMPA